MAAWTLLDDDWELVANKAGATRLGFSLLLGTLSVVVCVTWPAQIPLSLPLFDFASQAERSAATCVRRRRPGHVGVGNLHEGSR